MSISTQLSRISGIRDAIRDTLISWGVISDSAADLSDCSIALDGITDNGSALIEISTASQEITIGEGFHDGTGIARISLTEQAKLIPSNIVEGVTILGVEGNTPDAGNIQLQAKTVTPTKSGETVTPDSGYDGLSAVTVNPIPSDYQDITVTTAGAGDVLTTKVFIGANGQQTAGTMPNNGAISGTFNGLSVTAYTVPAGYHNGAGTVSLTNDIETALAAI